MSDDPLATFIARLERALADATFARLVLAKPRTAGGDLVRVTARPLTLKGAPTLSFVHTHRTRDLTKNLAFADGVQQVRALLESTFGHAHLFTASDEIQLLTSKKGKRTLLQAKASHAPAPAAQHDREKHRFLDLDRAFLAELGVTDAQHRLVPLMSRKWKQINKFIEVLDDALDATALKGATRLDVIDFGSGKGYLTFAMHDYLRFSLGLPARVTGVELRPDMVALCAGAAQRLALDGLHFEQGDVRTVVPEAIDIMIALHACDTATDFALHTGVRAGAAIIMCSPCCHKELRPQLLSPHPLRPILKHGVHLGQQAEMLTDGLRALLLEACGYDTQVFEFVSLEHTNKNKMILAVKRAASKPPDVVWQQIREIKGFYGIREQCLETLLLGDRESLVS
ncbi:MAG TPA: SAM-dependent methyltransferase [Burkholderiaceae bacterium]|nr:SAM-dependent methyltransferase [Burkholderiaceae bacterium]